VSGGADVPAHLSIGEVLALLQEEFPDCTISKIRFLESQGLIQPDRTASGYRKFYDADIDQLRWILRQQRDHFLPLKVIRKMLDEGIDRYDPGGGEQPTLFTPTGTDLDHAEPEEFEDAVPASSGDDRNGAPRGGDNGEDPTSPARSPRHPAVASAPQRRTPSARRSTVRGSGSGSRADRPTSPRRSAGSPVHETPADVVAALQEDPRRTRAKGDRRQQPHPGDPAGPESSGHHVGPDRPEVPGPGDAIHPGDATEAAAGPTSPGGTRAEEPDGTGDALTAEEVCSVVGIDAELLAGLERFGLVAGIQRGGEAVYGRQEVTVCRLAARYAELGVEPRHLRMYLVAAEREAGFVEQLAVPLLKQRNPAAREQARALARELEAMGGELHSLLLRRELGPDLGG
jgi:DNA-binding transcriptional MerR regulator